MLKDMVQRQVETAFELMDDLKVDVAFTAQEAPQYNFATHEVTQVNECAVSIEGVVDKTYTEIIGDAKGGIPTKLKEVFIDRTKLPGNFQNFDSAVIDGEGHTVLSYNDNGYVVTFVLAVN